MAAERQDNGGVAAGVSLSFTTEFRGSWYIVRDSAGHVMGKLPMPEGLVLITRKLHRLVLGETIVSLMQDSEAIFREICVGTAAAYGLSSMWSESQAWPGFGRAWRAWVRAFEKWIQRQLP